MVLEKLPVLVLLIWMSKARAYCVAEGAGGGCLDFFFSSNNSNFSLPLFGRQSDID